jgi:hephaestin
LQVPERAGPGPHDPSSVVWMYHSHTDEIADGYAGLIGPMIIT